MRRLSAADSKVAYAVELAARTGPARRRSHPPVMAACWRGRRHHHHWQEHPRIETTLRVMSYGSDALKLSHERGDDLRSSA
ncbi:MAG: hypothetical protein E5W89_20605 [Mesorhizobium sp.]|nr:MAG: hypothetical protein E5W89_20605 [Mesorhizobium sp.]